MQVDLTGDLQIITPTSVWVIVGARKVGRPWCRLVTFGAFLGSWGATGMIQEEKGGRIGEILIRQKIISEADLLKALGEQFEMRFLSTLPMEDLNTDYAEMVPIQFLKKYRMVPLMTPDGTYIASNDPLMFQPLDDLTLLLGWRE